MHAKLSRSPFVLVSRDSISAVLTAPRRALASRRGSALALLPLAALVSACGGSTPPPAAPPRPSSQEVFDKVAPSVVAIMNDDKAERDRQAKVVEAMLGDETQAPKHVIDVSARKEPQPEGTGFMVDGGRIVTAAHVVQSPMHLKVITRAGKIVDADLVSIDEVRDIAVLKPKQPLDGVPPLPVDDRPTRVGEPVWALGHTGEGYWQLSWGMSEGIASGIVDAFGAKLLLMDAMIYPGFSGGPVVDLGADGMPHVVGVNHATLFPFSNLPVYNLPSAVSAVEIKAVLAGQRPAIEAVVADYAKQQRGRQWADLFVTDTLAVGRDAAGQPVASILGDAHDLDAEDGAPTHVPVVGMFFGLGKGGHDIEFTTVDPAGKVKATTTAHTDVKADQRVAFASSDMSFIPEASGRYFVIAKEGGKEIGRSGVAVEMDNDDDSLMETKDTDAVDDGNPDVDVVVAEEGSDDPLAMVGIRGDWSETSYPKRVDYSWFARASRGWTGTNISMTAFVLDDSGKIIGRSDGCYHGEVRPEMPWSCSGTGGAVPPMPMREGHYDIVFAINDRPVAWWPMEATLRPDSMPGSDLTRWAMELQRTVKRRGDAAKKKAHDQVRSIESQGDTDVNGSKGTKPSKKSSSKSKPAKPSDQ